MGRPGRRVRRLSANKGADGGAATGLCKAPSARSGGAALLSSDILSPFPAQIWGRENGMDFLEILMAATSY